MSSSKSKVHHYISSKVLLVLGVFLLTALFALWFFETSVPLLTKHFEILRQPSCTLEAKVCPDGSAVGKTGPRCEFAPCKGTAQISAEEHALQEAYPFLTWAKTTSAPLTYTDFTQSTTSATIPVQLARYGKGTIPTMSGCFRECETDRLKKLGWQPDMNQAADSPAMSIWGYTRTVNGKRQLLQVTYKNNSTIIKPNEPIEILCPCSLEYEVKITNRF